MNSIEPNQNKHVMWPAIIGAGALTVLIKTIFDGFQFSKSSKKRLFISFDMEDARYRDFLVAQARNGKTPFAFVDMSVKEPWNENSW